MRFIIDKTCMDLWVATILYDMIFVTANSIVNSTFIINKPRRNVIEKFVSDTQFSGVIGLSMDLPIKFMMYAHVLETINNFSGFLPINNSCLTRSISVVSAS
jgi:hypothetical protein